MRIDIWSDIACPWCYIGLTRFQRVLDAFDHKDGVEVVLHSFQLDPRLPDTYDGSETDYLVASKGVPAAQIREMFGHVEAAAATEGLSLDFDAVKVANSWRAHRLLQAAAAAGADVNGLETALFKAHFTDGHSISNTDLLVQLGIDAGLDEDTARRAASRPGGSTDPDDLDAAVTADLQQARSLGISGVPFFVLGEKYGLSGAQPEAVFRNALQQVWEETHPAAAFSLTPILQGDGAGEACGPGGCD